MPLPNEPIEQQPAVRVASGLPPPSTSSLDQPSTTSVVDLPTPPEHVAFLNPAAAWLSEPSATRGGLALLLTRRFDGSNSSTWYRGHAAWRGGSIRNFVGESCLVAALATTEALRDGTSSPSPLHLHILEGSAHFAHDCVAERAVPWSQRSRIEDARLFRRADGGMQMIYSSPMGGEAHAVFSAPLELLHRGTQTRVRARLAQRVALCTDLLAKLRLGPAQKNWSPFSHGGNDFVVFSPVPLRIFRVDHVSGVCTEAAATTPPALLARLADCNSGETATPELTPREQSRAWRRCSGSRLPLPRGVGGAAERKMRRSFTLSLGGGTPGVLLCGTGTGSACGGAGAASPLPALLTRSGLARAGTNDVLLFAGHSRLHAATPALVDRMLGGQSGSFAEVGPEREWHASYPKIYHVFWYALAAPSTAGAPFELASVSRLFTPPNTRLSQPKIVYPTGLLQTSTNRLLLTYGELDIYSHAWSPSLAEVARSMMPPSALASAAASTATLADSTVADASALPLILRPAEAARRRLASAAAANELSTSLYGAPMPLGAPPFSRATSMADRECRSLGYELHWNTALHAFPGAPASPHGGCEGVVSEEADSPQRCCAICAAAGGDDRGGRRSRRAACSSWSYFAPRCYWTPGCSRTLIHREIMWGAVAGLQAGVGRSER